MSDRPDRVRLPADVELEDKLAFGLTARQLGLLGATALVAYALYTLAAPRMPLPLAVGVTVPVLAAGVLLALGRRDGLSGDRFALTAVRYLAQPRRRLLAPEGIPAPLPGGPRRPAVAPLELPVRALRRSGLVELADGSFALLLRAASSSFALKSDEEQAALVEAFGRYLNGLADPIELCVRSEPVELTQRADALEQTAAAITEPALAEAARAHAEFLRALPAEGELRRRELLLVLVTRAREHTTARTTLTRRAAEAVELLRAAGVDLHALEGEQAARALARLLDPPGPPAGSTLTGTIRGC